MNQDIEFVGNCVFYKSISLLKVWSNIRVFIIQRIYEQMLWNFMFFYKPSHIELRIRFAVHDGQDWLDIFLHKSESIQGFHTPQVDLAAVSLMIRKLLDLFRGRFCIEDEVDDIGLLNIFGFWLFLHILL